jgi:hypothetical protein
VDKQPVVCWTLCLSLSYRILLIPLPYHHHKRAVGTQDKRTRRCRSTTTYYRCQLLRATPSTAEILQFIFIFISCSIYMYVRLSVNLPLSRYGILRVQYRVLVFQRPFAPSLPKDQGERHSFLGSAHRIHSLNPAKAQKYRTKCQVNEVLLEEGQQPRWLPVVHCGRLRSALAAP